MSRALHGRNVRDEIFVDGSPPRRVAVDGASRRYAECLEARGACLAVVFVQGSDLGRRGVAEQYMAAAPGDVDDQLLQARLVLAAKPGRRVGREIRGPAEGGVGRID